MNAAATAVSPSTTKVTRREFLSARWQALAMLNWAIDPAALAPLIPAGTELDFHEGRTFVSMVGFLFLDTRLLGLPVPLHRNFEEVNLRFYVRRTAHGDLRRGVSFIKEIVPKWAIAQTARWCYNEPYVALRMQHGITGPLREHIQTSDTRESPDNAARPTDPKTAGQVSYRWHFADRWNSLSLEYAGAPAPLVAGSLEEFIAEHYWGYCAQRDGGTVEYEVEHPPWHIWQGTNPQFDCEIAQLYTPRFAELLCRPPTSAFLADGSAVAVMKPTRIV